MFVDNFLKLFFIMKIKKNEENDRLIFFFFFLKNMKTYESLNLENKNNF